MTRLERAQDLAVRLPRIYPGAHCELNFSTPLELLVATILSAQCTDKRVNLVTPALFARCRSAKDFANISQNELAMLCDFEKASMSRIESGQTNTTILTLRKICSALDVHICDLMEDREK